MYQLFNFLSYFVFHLVNKRSQISKSLLTELVNYCGKLAKWQRNSLKLDIHKAVLAVREHRFFQSTMGRDRDKFRKFESGFAKREKKNQREEFTKNIRGSLEKFLPNSKKVDTIKINEKSHIEKNTLENSMENNFEIDETQKNDDIEECLNFDEEKVDAIDNLSFENHRLEDTIPISTNSDKLTDDLLNENKLHLLKDHANWPIVMNNKIKYEIVKLGLSRVINHNFPITVQDDGSKRKFSTKLYYRNLINGEQINRFWLIYSKLEDCVLCYCCKLFSTHVNYEKETSLSSKAIHNDAFRGTTDVLFAKGNGKFLCIIVMLAKFDPIMEEHLRRIKDEETRVHYLSHDIQDELIQIMANEIRQKIISLIKVAKYFTVVMDCTPDIGHQEQLTILIRIVNMGESNESDPTIQEYFLDFVDVNSTTRLNLSEILIKQLELYNINIGDCRGQAYDNGSNMVGKYQGVQTRISNINPRAFFTPCAAHSLNLVLCDAAQNSPRAISFFGSVRRVYTLFSASTNRWSIIQKHCKLFTVKQWSDTRWESRLNSVKALRLQFPHIIEALEEVYETANDLMAKSEANSLLNEISSYEFILSLVIWYDILEKVNIVSKSLQSQNMEISISTKMVYGILEHLKQYRITGFDSAKNIANKLTSEIDIPVIFKCCRIRKKKKMFSYEHNDEPILNEEDRFRINYFLVVINEAIESINKRFHQLESYSNNFGFLYQIGKVKNMEEDELRKYCKDLHLVLFDGDQNDLEGLDLYSELLIFRMMIDDNTTPLKALSILKKTNGSFPNISIALRIMLTIPVTSACAERSFSKLKLIKTYLRNKLSQDKLSDLALISIEQEISNNIDYQNLLETFASKKSRKKCF
ncbi:hypothetical protein QTP88_008575 [Uroleucon formosanum]